MLLDTYEAKESKFSDAVFEPLSSEWTALVSFYAEMQEKEFLGKLIMSHVPMLYGIWMDIINSLHGVLLFMDVLMDFHRL